MDGSVSNSCVIVALPSEDDQVRKYSSEKEPHLTLLYLGENKFDPTELAHITEYVEYAASLLPCFTLDVDSRGELGPNRADVLFFNKKWSKTVETFRSHLLQDPFISAMYHSTDQFPEWLPHLTMGFPDTPAKKDNRDYPGFSYVRFDRIALWTGNSSGPTFQLKTYADELEVAMSQIEQGRSAVSDILENSAVSGVLEHHGVKGMKWGVRRSKPQLDSASGRVASADAKVADAAQAKVNSGGTRSLSNHELQGLITRMSLERQYQSMQTQHQSAMDKGVQTTQKILKVAKTVEDVRRFMDTPTGKAVKTGLKMAVAAHTGGASAAAGAAVSTGIGLAVNRMNQ